MLWTSRSVGVLMQAAYPGSVDLMPANVGYFQAKEASIESISGCRSARVTSTSKRIVTETCTSWWIVPNFSM